MGEQSDSYGPFMDAEDKTTYTIQNLDDNKTYYFAVSAYDKNGNEGNPSTEVMLLAVDDTTPPTTPGDLNASVLSSTQIKLTWNPATDNVGVTNYKIYRNGNLIKTKSSTLAQQYTNSNLTPDTLYTYMVTAVDAAGNESNPAQTSATTVAAGDTTPPSTPGNLSATSVSPTQINLNWNASSDDVGVAEYQVRRNGDLLATTNNTSFSNTNLTPDTLYSYAVIALDEAGNESNPAAASAITPSAPDTTPPSVPGNFDASAISPSEINLTWTAATDDSGVTGYNVSRNNVLIATTAATTYADASLTPDTLYTYSVTALDEAGNESNPAAASAITPSAPDTTPPTTISVFDIVVTKQNLGKGNKQGAAVVTIHDNAGNPVDGATVIGDFSGRTTETVSGVTNETGQVTIFSSLNRAKGKGRKSGGWCIEVTNVTHGTLAYDSSLNPVTKSCEDGDIF
jgi:chitodextrinase